MIFAAEVELTPEVFTQAIEANLLETFTLLGSSIGEVIKADETIGFFTGVPIPMFNGVVSPLFSLHNADTYIDFFIDQARSRGLPMMWQVGPRSRPSDIGNRLIQHGFVGVGDIPGMAVDLATLVHEASPEAVAIQRIRDLDALETAIRLMSDVFGIPEMYVDTFAAMFGAGGNAEDAPMVHYGASVTGRMVAASTVVYAGGVAGIYNVATAEGYRGRGLGRAVTLAPLLDARDKGYRIGILQSSEMALSLYRRLGFDHYCDFKTFVWSLEEPAAP